MCATQTRRSDPTLKDYEKGLRAGDRVLLARAITLIESTKREHAALAQKLLQALLPDTGKAYRVGITGVPGVGKSTAIDQLGTNLTGNGHKVAVLAVDPSSTRSGGSVLGDKTRMPRLAQNDSAFIRPSPTSGTLGGVTRKTRETMALCEAAGYDVILVETVGVGQSETAVAEMVDFFLALMLPGAGDELQGIKKGIVEIADMIAVNKADGDNVERANAAASIYRAALNIITPTSPNWTPPVVTISGKENIGLDTLWTRIEEHRETLTTSGEFAERRQVQAVNWMHDMLEDRLKASLRNNRKVAESLPKLESDVREGKLTPALAVEEIMALMET
ncbi:MAG: methylmalonyl Co-A mutase-associated GTPase MeaB [Hyphomicrobiaceae bacterium]|nr:methylmalonyl Co-A mutase-associated GTPase MeaB [Hyphomicrobiaceae bacterium]